MCEVLVRLWMALLDAVPDFLRKVYKRFILVLGKTVSHLYEV